MNVTRLVPTASSLAGVTCLALAIGTAAVAQEKFPSKPIEVVTHAGVGGGTDITARMMMVQAPAAFGQELVIANKTGGAGAASLAYAASRPKDGHTVLLITQTHLLTILQGRGGGVKAEDIVAVARATEDPQILMVGKGSPYKTAKEFIEASKTKGLKYGTTHVGGVDHLAVVGFAKSAGLQTPIVVPFRGGADIALNLVGGNLEASLLNYGEAEAQIKAGEVRPLLTLASDRLPAIPDVPTAKEIGIDANFSTTRGFVVLKGTPEDRIKILEEGLVKSMSGKLFQDYLNSSGQAQKSVVGRQEWQAQIDEFFRTGQEALASIGVR